MVDERGRAMAARTPKAGEGKLFAAEDETGDPFWGDFSTTDEQKSDVGERTRTESGVILNPESGSIG
jgi:hypothetical protein